MLAPTQAAATALLQQQQGRQLRRMLLPQLTQHQQQRGLQCQMFTLQGS
jgi:hypothetical protein